MPVFKQVLHEELKRNLNTDMPPWMSKSIWNNANGNLAHTIICYRRDLKRAFALAREIQDLLESIFPRLDELCNITCPWCPDPCCLAAKVWVDFKDLLFLHLRNFHIPSVHLLQDVDKLCRYSGPKGCILHRISRPWICTWYLCPTQRVNFYKKTRSVQNAFHQLVRDIKAGRKEMEDEFMRVVS